MTDENLQAEVPAEAANPIEEKADPATAEETPPEEETVEESQPEEKPKPKGGFQRRIDELTRNWREAERRNDELMAMLQRQIAPPEPEAPKGPPTLEQHGYDEAKYQAALTDYVRNLTQAEARAVYEQQEAQRQQQTRVQTFRQREAEFAATVEDYADKVYDPSLPLSPPVVELIAESDIGPKVAYYLAEHPDIARSLSQLNPVQAAREFGRIEAALAAPSAKKPVSKAPAPPPKLSAVEPEVDKDPDKMSVDEWVRWREKQLRKKGNR